MGNSTAVDTREEMLDIVRAAKYPPSGTRSIDYLMTLAEAEELNYNTVVMPMIETAEGVRHIDEIVHLSSPLVFSSQVIR